MSTRFHLVSAQPRHFGSPPNTTVYVSLASGFHHRATVYTLCHRPYSESSTETAVLALAITIMNTFSREFPPNLHHDSLPPHGHPSCHHPWPVFGSDLFRYFPLFRYLLVRSTLGSYCWSLLVFISSFQAETQTSSTHAHHEYAHHCLNVQSPRLTTAS